MPDPTLDPSLLATPRDQPAYRPFPELAKAIRSKNADILKDWRGRTLLSMPELSELPVKEFQDDIAHILTAMADALESNDPPDLHELIRVAPKHGFQRYLQEYDLSDLFAEERVLRRVIVARVEDALARQCTTSEAAALHAMIDIMLQQGVLALVQAQKHDLRQATEAQLRYLSFLSHDLGNNLFVITANLEVLEQQLAAQAHMQESAGVIRSSLEVIQRTRTGMRNLLEHERLKQPGEKASNAPVNLRELVTPIVTLAATDALDKGLSIVTDVDPAAVSNTDADLVTIVLQNLIGNAVKFTLSDKARDGERTVRVEARAAPEGNGDVWVVSVVDNGPGIPADQLERLFGAFERLAMDGEKSSEKDRGFGLGLAIASQAAKLLGTTITVKTKLGQGSTFSFTLPRHPGEFVRLKH